MKFSLGSLAETQRFAEIIAGHVRPRDMVVLAGEMGAGKTTFTQFFGRALGVTDLITSPTFNLLHNYGSGRMALHHADLYRLERTGELEDLGLDELQDSGGVIAVEWGDIVGDELGDALVLRFEHVDQATNDASGKTDEMQVRSVTVSSRGAQWESRFRKLTDELASKFTVLARG
ncbi:MAG: tRNA (adenosine(37)-N6)-threonylcarbamoyltransferase complex ATPase subunit type 1 TsaE [Actinomycetota bacterium]|nr:tRNA (adenosine(37)-N6)-threonylcarbamoyltransferase complex ATPase subunit type 1 TsaE [Actinomycetota bacterium]MDA3042209.1 tRNA (adenosine(37)-N6)-threonylcarbamoyltransferase complex ATPase subunit type 1 TsaE [Actinomycetota bacterium]